MMKIPYPLWMNLPDRDKIQNLFDRCVELEKTTESQMATIRQLFDRVKTLEAHRDISK